MEDERLIRRILDMDEAECADVFRSARYGDAMRPEVCPQCDTSRFRRVKDRVRVDECCRCGAHLSVTAGTALHGLRQPLAYALVAMVLITRDGSISTNKLAKILRIPWKSARHLGHRVRRALAGDTPELRLDQVHLEAYPPVVRRDPGEFPRTRWQGRVLPPTLRAVALVDDRTGAAVIRLGEVGWRKALAIKHLVEEHLEGAEEIEWPSSTEIATLRRLDHVLRRTHQRVSRRWLQLYLGALGWCAGVAAGERTWRALQVVLRAQPKRWTQLRPARMQDEHALSRFRHPRPER